MQHLCFPDWDECIDQKGDGQKSLLCLQNMSKQQLKATGVFQRHLAESHSIIHTSLLKKHPSFLRNIAFPETTLPSGPHPRHRQAEAEDQKPHRTWTTSLSSQEIRHPLTDAKPPPHPYCGTRGNTASKPSSQSAPPLPLFPPSIRQSV
jgi:hypothetical protein